MKNTLPITEREKDNTRYLLLDTSKTVFRNFKWDELGAFGKRKCENFIVLSNSNTDRKYIRVIYAETA